MQLIFFLTLIGERHAAHSQRDSPGGSTRQPTCISVFIMDIVVNTGSPGMAASLWAFWHLYELLLSVISPDAFSFHSFQVAHTNLSVYLLLTHTFRCLVSARSWACEIGPWPGRLSSFSAIALLVGSSDL